MNPIEIALNRPGNKKTHLRVDIRCKWTPLFPQGEHFITTIFWIPGVSPLKVKLRVTENILAIILIPITVRTEELANLFVTLKISRTLDKRENHSLDNLLDYMDKNNKRVNEVSRINILHALVDLYELYMKCLWQNPASSNHWEITESEWSRIYDPIVITAHSLRQLQPGN